MARLLTRPTLARRDAPCPKQGRSSLLLAFKRVAWIGPKPRALREHILIVRTLRAKGTIQDTLSILFLHPAKHLYATMRHDETPVIPATHAHRPLEPWRSGSRTVHGRFTRHNRTVLQFRYGKRRSIAELSRALPHRLPRGQYPRNRQALDNHLQGWKYILSIRRPHHRLENQNHRLLRPLQIRPLFGPVYCPL